MGNNNDKFLIDLKTGEIGEIRTIEYLQKEKATKKILKNYWEYSTDFERDHKSLSLITEALGITEDEVDEFFITAGKL